MLAFVRQYFDHYYTSPTYAEILGGTDLKARSHLYKVIDYLVAEGLLERQDGVARGLRIPGWTAPIGLQVHHKGYIAASNLNPLLALDEFDPETTVSVPPDLIPYNLDLSDLFALTVRGDSMEDALIRSLAQK